MLIELDEQNKKACFCRFSNKSKPKNHAFKRKKEDFGQIVTKY
jgi:hypothetical protein